MTSSCKSPINNFYRRPNSQIPKFWTCVFQVLYFHIVWKTFSLHRHFFHPKKATKNVTSYIGAWVMWFSIYISGWVTPFCAKWKGWVMFFLTTTFWNASPPPPLCTFWPALTETVTLFETLLTLWADRKTRHPIQDRTICVLDLPYNHHHHFTIIILFE